MCNRKLADVFLQDDDLLGVRKGRIDWFKITKESPDPKKAHETEKQQTAVFPEVTAFVKWFNRQLLKAAEIIETVCEFAKKKPGERQDYSATTGLIKLLAEHEEDILKQLIDGAEWKNNKQANAYHLLDDPYHKLDAGRKIRMPVHVHVLGQPLGLHSLSHPNALKPGFAVSSSNKKYENNTKPPKPSSRKAVASSSSAGSTIAEADLLIAKENIEELRKQITDLVAVRDDLHLQLHKSMDLGNGKLSTAARTANEMVAAHAKQLRTANETTNGAIAKMKKMRAHAHQFAELMLEYTASEDQAPDKTEIGLAA